MSNIFELPSGNLFPHHVSQKTWDYARGSDSIHLKDGNNVYSFKGELGQNESLLRRIQDKLPDQLSEYPNHGKVQVHRSDPSSIYFTLKEKGESLTFTLRHVGGNKWKAIPKLPKERAQKTLLATEKIGNKPAPRPLKQASKLGGKQVKKR